MKLFFLLITLFFSSTSGVMLIFVTFSTENYSNEQKNYKEQTKNILILFDKKKLEKDVRKNYRSIIDFLSKKSVFSFVYYNFESSQDISLFLKNDKVNKKKKSFSKIYVLTSLTKSHGSEKTNESPAPTKTQLLVKKRLKKIKEATKETKTIFYFHDANKLTHLIDLYFLEYFQDFSIIRDTEILFKEFTNIIEYVGHTVNYEDETHLITIPASVVTVPKSVMKEKSCFGFKNNDKIRLRSYKKDHRVYSIERPQTYKFFESDSIFYCFFRILNISSSNPRKFLVYEIFYPKPKLELSPKKVLFFYNPETIVEQEFTIHSQVTLQDVNISIEVDELKGNPPVVFSKNQKWLWNSKKKKFIFADMKGGFKRIDIEKSYNLKLAVIGKKEESLYGKLVLKKKSANLAKFDLSFEEYIWGANTFIWFFIYFYEILISLFLIVLLWGLHFFLKKKRIELSIKKGTSSNEFIFMIEKSETIILSPDKNPFNCIIPFIDKKYAIKVNGSVIDIHSKNSEARSLDLDESLGKATVDLGPKGEAVFKKQNFQDKKVNSVIIMQLKPKSDAHHESI